VLGVLGDNGAGKSTLMKILAGSLERDRGEILMDGEPVHFTSPRDSRAAGIEMIYQDLALCDDLDVASNFFLGREPRRFGLLDLDRMHRETVRELAALGARVPSTRVDIKSLSGGQRQAVAIARTRLSEAKIVLMDEPTAAISVRQVAQVLDLIRRLRDQGIAIVLISHRMPDVFAVADRVAVLRRGRKVAEKAVAQSSPEEVTGLITGAIQHA
jgi:simple sugar transport system ATP-binding protein